MTNRNNGRLSVAVSILAALLSSGTLILGGHELASLRKTALSALDALGRLEASLAAQAAAGRESEVLLLGSLDALARHSPTAPEALPAREELDAAGERAEGKPSDRRDLPAAADDLAALRFLAAGHAELSAGRYASAAVLFGDAARLQPDDASAVHHQAACRFLANPVDSSTHAMAERLSRAALYSDPGDALALEVLARLSLERSEWAAAVGYFERLVASGKADAEVLDAARFAAAWAAGGSP